MKFLNLCSDISDLKIESNFKYKFIKTENLLIMLKFILINQRYGFVLILEKSKFCRTKIIISLKKNSFERIDIKRYMSLISNQDSDSYYIYRILHCFYQ